MTRDELCIKIYRGDSCASTIAAIDAYVAAAVRDAVTAERERVKRDGLIAGMVAHRGTEVMASTAMKHETEAFALRRSLADREAAHANAMDDLRAARAALAALVDALPRCELCGRSDCGNDDGNCAPWPDAALAEAYRAALKLLGRTA